MYLLDFLNENASGLGVILTVVTIFGSAIAVLFAKKKSTALDTIKQGVGGNGGNAKVGGSGIAVGGRGGRSGVAGHGGSGGDASVTDDGLAVGGMGGDAGVSWRPSLGGPSPLEQMQFDELHFIDIPVDEFGFMIPGRGGVGGSALNFIKSGNQELPLVPLLRYLNYWSPATIDSADAQRPADPQGFWNVVQSIAPSHATAAEAHVTECIRRLSDGKNKPPSPYFPISNKLPSA